jgi:hypothetical protein
LGAFLRLSSGAFLTVLRGIHPGAEVVLISFEDIFPLDSDALDIVCALEEIPVREGRGGAFPPKKRLPNGQQRALFSSDFSSDAGLGKDDPLLRR